MASAEGNEVRMRVIELGKRVRQSMMDGGDFPMEMDSFIAHITRDAHSNWILGFSATIPTASIAIVELRVFDNFAA
ncbi:hypothetical protein RND71_026170 [Anisodus tanguticus]|uniref:Uncharacterized protein n=1 Tax=Anisodus tanguticus TaxID=243964 RepID=A0AAE1RN09_9SOLA|nr:hypothetical protein RND71_026170 [Anisodus tanguticus]